MSKKVIVASTNPIKIQAALNGLNALYPDESFTAAGMSADSGVRDQPIGDDETRLGARNRALAARTAHPDAAYTVGIEGGCDYHDNGEVSVFAWIVVIAQDGREGVSKTGTFFLPQEVATLVQQGMELGDADDVVFGKSNSKQQTGSVGLLTGDIITRESYYAHAMTLALIPFKNPTLTF